MKRIILLPVLWISLVSGIFGVEIRVVTYNVELGLEAPGTDGFDAVEDVLTRIGADVIALQEVRASDLSGSPSNLESLANSLASSLGWGIFFTYAPTTSGVFDNDSRPVYISRYPLSEITDIVSPSGARDLTRRIPAVVVDVPGTANDPTLINLHLKCCFELDDFFRRAVEMHRVITYLNDEGLTAEDNVILLGDFNLLGSDQTIAELPLGLPQSYVLGSDVSFPVQYYDSPGEYVDFLPMTQIDSRQTDGSDVTQGSSATLDFILATSSMTDRAFATEIYHSENDSSNAVGLPKVGMPLAAGTSDLASDHLAVFGDFELDDGAEISLSVSEASVMENGFAGEAVLSVTLSPAPSAGSVTVNLASNDLGEARLSQTSLVFPNGVSTMMVDVIPQGDGVIDGAQVVQFTASDAGGGGYAAGQVDITVLDVDASSYRIAQIGVPVVEDFTSFAGNEDPPGWALNATSALDWLGYDNGSGDALGFYTYGATVDESALGVLVGGGSATAVATYSNQTGEVITALEVAFSAEQWRAFMDGDGAAWSAELVSDGSVVPLSALDFQAVRNLPTGAVDLSTPLTTIVTGLDLANGETFDLRFRAENTGGGSGSASTDIFINELHYDNDSFDEGEFLEVVVCPGYAGTLDEVNFVFYNGMDGQVYQEHSLNTFVLGSTVSGYRIFYKELSNIQNGGSDGIATVVSGEVTAFESYEGILIATDGPASGMTSVDIGVSQSSTAPIGQDSIGRQGIGADSSEMSWVRFDGAFTRGEINTGQSFVAATGPQGIALDDISVTALRDTDQDGTPDVSDLDDDGDTLPDLLETNLGLNPLLSDTDGDGTLDGEEDADGDGWTNAAEVSLTGTDPSDGASFFCLSIFPDPSDESRVMVSFPSLTGITYRLNRSVNLSSWDEISMIEGDGNVQMLSIEKNELEQSEFYQVELVTP